MKMMMMIQLLMITKSKVSDIIKKSNADDDMMHDADDDSDVSKLELL
jgi:hypothetical protein